MPGAPALLHSNLFEILSVLKAQFQGHLLQEALHGEGRGPLYVLPSVPLLSPQDPAVVIRVSVRRGGHCAF